MGATVAARSATITILLLLSQLLIIPKTAKSANVPGLDTFLAQQFRLDPQSPNDTFYTLPSSLKKAISLSSSSFQHHPVSSLISDLLSLDVSVSVHVKLVGPSFSADSQLRLSSFLSASLTSNHFHVITPFDSKSHHLSLSHTLHLDVSLSHLLSSALSSAVGSALSAAPSSLRSPLVSINYSIVDQIIAKDFAKESQFHGFYIYLLNLGPQSKPYAYSYTSGDSSPAFTKCLGTIWTGKERYLWIDLGAGPVDYGPGLSGDGVLPRGEFHPLAALHGRPKSKKAVLADLASLVSSAYEVLLVPSLRIPVPFESSLVVQFIHVYELESSDRDNYGLDWKMIEKTFSDEAHDGGLLLGSQSLIFKRYEVKYTDCALCSFAISRSINSYTSRFLFDNYTLIASEYVDSKRLHQILSDSAEDFKRLAGFSEDDDYGRVLPVYVFDLDYSMLLLLDRYHQSVAFKDMVIAIRTKNTQTVSDYSCNGRHVFTQTRELERPLIGSILQSMWGVSPTHLVWSQRHNSTLVDYTWSVGRTPFGPFSEISSLSFVQKDAARRNVLLTWLNESITGAVDVLESINAHGGYQMLMKGRKHDEFLERWFLFKYKLDKVISSLSHLDFDMASYFLRSSDHDLYAIHSIVYHASQELEASLVCFKDPPFPWASVSMSAITFSVICYVYTKRDKLFRNKRKQF
ncbi:hypothetical protein Nepgr_028875 [Nepenthes gracilis]|uniref:DUF7906 domain-containing protein n=1 Tax=Nepenthes gracilis TaxID=150966 RepID=A0AAD3TEE2_NEPGR|nr:hypothetical protein Nepgr_028875 [Nepenthes gracilis]